MVDQAWTKQARSLIRVQQEGPSLEKAVRKTLGWKGGRVTYDEQYGYQLQVDAAYPSTDAPRTIVSVTYTKPDKPGHSNENKLQLKVGELALLKHTRPELRLVLAIGGTGAAWLPYVLKAFEILYDEVVYLWTLDGANRLAYIADNPSDVPLRHTDFWESLRGAWRSRQTTPEGTEPPCGLVRYRIADILRNQTRIVHDPSLIENEVARLCLQRSKDSGGAEWRSYLQGRWQSIEMSRNYFNPVEAVVEILLTTAGLEFEGGVGRDVPVRSLLHYLGMSATSVNEDFILYSRTLQQPVYVQCKASGGGRKQHGKNIQNRGKEQITRGIIYQCKANSDGDILWHEQDFHWISVLDGDWGVTKRQPLKYIRMLELAGYSKIFCANDLLTANGEVKREDNPLTHYLTDVLQCRLKASER